MTSMLSVSLPVVPSSVREDTERAGDGNRFCTNDCMLRRAVVAPDDWARLTRDRIQHGALCRACRDELRAFFLASAQEKQ